MLPAIRSLLLCGLVAGAAVTQASAAHAYQYRFRNDTKQPIVYINLHTVSALCHDVEWKGTLAPAQTVNLSSASICLVDGAYAQDQSGKGLRWSASIGVNGGEFTAYNGEIIWRRSLRRRR